jgi:hypothetical protein
MASSCNTMSDRNFPESRVGIRTLDTQILILEGTKLANGVYR